ncbi:DUF2835 domain-containing protein [Alteromonas sp. ASW11-19]|uniref:DUF2835 domain-containing protein n=1 Tax=Alteromonas salexigens TaxID=2982530 RepID=A0ABT2VM77_9ALTE|nr:DUF2835 domain-containing protein [Alteromonas salexigens]MCU7554169.1 DUF2835 domain-containing protein [Alteromonas salexigens]
MTNILPTDKVYFFSISVPYHMCEALYQSPNPAVVLTAENGVRVQVPTSRLRQFIGSNGVNGRFRMVVNAKNKIRSFERIR